MVGVAQEPQVAGLLQQNAVPVEGEGAGSVELVGEEADAVGLAVAVGVFEEEEAVGRSGQGTLFGLGAAEHAQPALAVPAHLHRVGQFGEAGALGEDLHLEAGLNF